MKQNNVKFLKFNGKTLVFLDKNGVYWIAIKPVCEALNVNYNRQYQNIRTNSILKAKFAKQQMQVPGQKQNRLYVCLPEQYIYGWIFSIKSENPDLDRFKEECYDILYKHFHGSITNRKSLINDKAKAQAELEALEMRYSEDDNYLRILELRQVIKDRNSDLRKLDKQLFSEAKTLWDQDFVDKSSKIES